MVFFRLEGDKYKINENDQTGLKKSTFERAHSDLKFENVVYLINQDGSDGTLPSVDELEACRAILKKCFKIESRKKRWRPSTITRRNCNLDELKTTISHINERIKVREVLDAREKLVEPPPYSNDTIPNALVEQWTSHNQEIDKINTQLDEMKKGYTNGDNFSLAHYIQTKNQSTLKSPQSKVFEQMLVAFNEAKGNPKESAINLIVLNIKGMCDRYPKECNRQTMIRVLKDNLKAYDGYIEKLFGKTSTEKSEAVPAPPVDPPVDPPAAPPVAPPVSPGTPPSTPRRSSRLTRINTTKITKIIGKALSLATSASRGRFTTASRGRFTTKKKIKKEQCVVTNEEE